MIGTNDGDFFFFEGTLANVNTTIINPYSGESFVITGQKNVNKTTYDGLGGFDVMFMTSEADVLLIDNGGGVPTVKSVETFISGAGDDVFVTASTTYLYGDLSIDTGAGNDLIWSGAGHDFISSAAGNDVINAGPGNDYIQSAQGNDILIPGAGIDRLIFYLGDGHDTVRGDPDGFLLEFKSLLQPSDLQISFSLGSDLGVPTTVTSILYGGLEDSVDVYYSSPFQIYFSNGRTTLDVGVPSPDQLIATPVPAALPIIAAALAGFGFAGWRTQSA